MSVNVEINFGGGLELLFGNKPSYKVSIPTEQGVLPFEKLLVYMKDELLEERPELFLHGDTVRPGILVLINDTDWELMGGHDSEISDNDTVTFISTLHGG